MFTTRRQRPRRGRAGSWPSVRRDEPRGDDSFVPPLARERAVTGARLRVRAVGYWRHPGLRI